MQIFGQLLIKYGLVFYKNEEVQIHTKYLVASSQNNPTFGTRKMKTSFGKLVDHSNMQPFSKYEIIWETILRN